MGKHRLSVHKLAGNYDAKRKYKTLTATAMTLLFVIIAGVALSLLVILMATPEMRDVMIRLVDPAEIGWGKIIVNFIISFGPIFIIVVPYRYRNAIIKKHRIEEMRIYVTGIGFVDREKGKEIYADYHAVKLSHGETQESFLIGSDTASIKSTEYRWQEFTHPDVLRNNLEQYGVWS
jgi:hypothetical protein